MGRRSFAGEPLTLERDPPFGSPDDLVQSGADGLDALIRRWGQSTSIALSLPAESELAEVVEQTALRALMLGALDAEHEAEDGEMVPVAKFQRDTRWTRKPFQEAIDSFLARKVVSPETFEAMTAQARARAFTVAGLMVNDVAIVHRELSASLQAGVDVRTFRKQLQERLELRGWLKPGPRREAPTVTGRPWHLETVFRNGVMGSYNRGRVQQMSDPDVLEARPFWQVRAVADSRSRPEHKAVHMKVLAADDAFWSTVGHPPWGHNCRCRIVSITQQRAESVGVTDGSTISGLPDSGWAPNTV